MDKGISSNKNNYHNKALILEYLTIAWNILEGVVSIIIGLLIGSVSLLAYGLESSVEVFSSAVTVWELKGTGHGREKNALRMIGLAYLLVSAYVFFDAVRSLFKGIHPEGSIAGIIFMILTIIIMLSLGFMKRSVGKKIKNNVVLADAKFSIIDAALSGTVLIGLILNTLLGWWWTDQALALFLSGVAFREGMKELL
jgi:divalent metal cation (Fe/Co/Zn/Cd) transporter